MTRLLHVGGALLLAAGLGSCARTDAPPALVQTDGGQVLGRVLDSGVKAWLGVPFAKPPVRELRWREPQPTRWTGVYNADRKMPECIQVLRPHNINHYFGEEATSEDCLFMNIWAPPDATAASRLPVIVFMYGSGGTIGSSGMANYDGEQVAKRGAIFVNFNYRVGILGFMAHPELTNEQGGHSGNYGYMDQTFALKWIQRNINAFGGDPAKVIISGQSAGAGSVTQQIFSPLAKGLFRGGVMLSGCNYTGSNRPLAEAEATGLEIQKRLEASSLDDMRQIPADRTSEVPYYFGTQDAYNMFRPTRNWTPWDRELSQKMTAVLIAFANTGSPETAEVTWPAWSPTSERYVNFGDRITLDTVNRARLTFMAAHRPPPGPPGGARRGPRD